jgi:hypothetical protein
MNAWEDALQKSHASFHGLADSTRPADISKRVLPLFRTFPTLIFGFAGSYPSFNPKVPGSRPRRPTGPLPFNFPHFQILGRIEFSLFREI